MSTNSIHAILSQDDLSEVAYFGHICERMGMIPHDYDKADNINPIGRSALREAESFEAGYKAGRARVFEEDNTTPE